MTSRRRTTLQPDAFRNRKDRIAQLLANGAGGFTTARRLAGLVDTLLSENFTIYAAGAPLAVVALGGYGRQELSFGSDLDIMVLTRDKTGGRSDEERMKEFYHALLLYGTDIGHSYRSFEDCHALLESDLDAWISILDARFICGEKRIFTEFRRSLRHSIKQSETVDVLKRIHALSDVRHHRYGRSTKLLEPNIKNSSGGFRDAQTVLWFLKVLGRLPAGRQDVQPSLRSMLESTVIRSIFPSSFLAHAKRSIDFLLRIRHHMHLQAGRQHDILEFSTQEAIAKRMGYRSTGSASNVERFMREYYEAANTIAELHARVGHWTKDRWLGQKAKDRNKTLSDGLHVRGNKMSPAPRTPLSTELLLRAYVQRASSSLEFSFAFEDLIHRQLTSLRSIRTKRESEAFASMFRTGTGLSETLHHMNRLGVLARLLPEWRPLVRFFQHNQYHYFTADEHTLTVIEKAEHLQDDQSVFGSVYRSLPRKDILFFACLFHDLTKPRRLDDHEITGAELSESVLHRFGLDSIANEVSFLVRNHLLMEQIAFRRNLSDPVTLRDFAARFSHPDRLKYLFILTYADLSAVNTNVLTDWKKSLLTELYMKTLPTLEQTGHSSLHEKTADTEEVFQSLPPAHADAHASLLNDDAYRLTFSRQEILEHIDAVQKIDTSTTIFRHWSDVTDITLIASDAPFVLAHVCGALYANDLNIIDARIFTRDDGIVIDKFKIVDSQTHRPLPDDRCRVIDEEIRDILRGTCSVDDLLEKHRRRWKRRKRHTGRNIRIDVTFEKHPQFTIIDVYGADTPGFLYRVSDTISRLGCTIHFAKIATRGDGIVDSFYIRERDGTLLTTERQVRIRAVLLERIQSMYTKEHPGASQRS
jgi:[protein-PII] uridylyltransferase